MRLPHLALVFAGMAVLGCSYLPDYASLTPSGVTVTEARSYILLKPEAGAPGATGFLFVPGGLVDPHAYIEAMAKVALEGPGYTVVIAKEPANLAVLNPGAALGLTGVAEGVSSWVIGGHSLGGVMAANQVKQNPTAFKALVLEAAYPADTDDLSSWTGPVLSLSAQFDGLATQADIEAAKPLLPAATTYSVIAGGCHGYFGSYGDQAGDGTPTTTREAQQQTAADQIASLMGSL